MSSNLRGTSAVNGSTGSSSSRAFHSKTPSLPRFPPYLRFWSTDMNSLSLVSCNFVIFLTGVSAFKVSYELDDRFIEYRKDAKWLVMFYAPWCHHCHKTEPVWEQVAQTFNQQESTLGLRVGKIDATKSTKSASEFHVKGFPTIKYIQGDQIYSYEGERTREDIEEFAHKAVGPAVRRISALQDLRVAEAKNEVFFIIVEGEKSGGDLRKDYQEVAEELLTSLYFYETDTRLATGNIPLQGWTTIAVYKDGKYFTYDGKKSVKEWIKQERLPGFVKITGGNFYQLVEMKKMIAIVVVDLVPYRNTMNEESKSFFDGLKTISMSDRDQYYENFSFGYVDGNEIVNHVFSEWISVPSVVVYDPVNEVYYVSGETPSTVTTQSIRDFLDGILAGSVRGSGGKGWFRKAYRFVYGIAAYFHKMFSTQPILSSILFGLPLGILSIIIVMMYTNDCTESKEDPDDDDSDHEKEE